MASLLTPAIGQGTGRFAFSCKAKVAQLVVENVSRGSSLEECWEPNHFNASCNFSVPEMGQNAQKGATLLTGAVKGTPAGPVRGSECDVVAHLVRDEGVAGSNPAPA